MTLSGRADRQAMIELDPQDVTNYGVLAKIYEDAGNYEQAEATLMQARDARPNDPLVYSTLAGFYNRQGDFEKTIDAMQKAAEKDAQNPEQHYKIAALLGQGVSRLQVEGRREERDGGTRHGRRQQGAGAQGRLPSTPSFTRDCCCASRRFSKRTPRCSSSSSRKPTHCRRRPKSSKSSKQPA
jgi:hypothetical protein